MVTFKCLFDIPLLINLFISSIELKNIVNFGKQLTIFAKISILDTSC